MDVLPTLRGFNEHYVPLHTIYYVKLPTFFALRWRTCFQMVHLLAQTVSEASSRIRIMPAPQIVRESGPRNRRFALAGLHPPPPSLTELGGQLHVLTVGSKLVSGAVYVRAPLQRCFLKNWNSTLVFCMPPVSTNKQNLKYAISLALTTIVAPADHCTIYKY